VLQRQDQHPCRGKGQWLSRLAGAAGTASGSAVQLDTPQMP